MRYLFISPHVDDSELMAGGMIARLVEEGHDVKVLTLSQRYDGIDLSGEWMQAMNALRVTNFEAFDFETRMFHKHSNEILQAFFKRQNYDFYVIPSIHDMHSDHEVTAKQAIRAFKHKNIISWMPEWNGRAFIKNYFVKLESRHVMKKLNALGCYKSQADRLYFNQDIIVSQMKINGMMANCEYAEAFQAVNLLV